MTKKKKIIISVSVISAVLVIAAAVLLLVFLLKPQRANEVEVDVSAYQILVKTEAAQGERTYRFKFVTEGETKEIGSDSHVLDITPYLWDDTLHFGSEYEVSVCLVEKTGVLAGDYGESKTFKAEIRLYTPQVNYDEQQQIITWNAVLGAEEYAVCYYDGDQVEEVTTQHLQYSLDLIKGGERNLFVRARSHNDGLLESDSSNIVSVTLHHKIAEITGAIINSEKILTLSCADKLDKVVLKRVSDNKEFVLSLASFSKGTNVYQLKFSVKFLDTSEEFTVTPVTDEYNTYDFEPTNVRL